MLSSRYPPPPPPPPCSPLPSGVHCTPNAPNPTLCLASGRKCSAEKNVRRAAAAAAAARPIVCVGADCAKARCGCTMHATSLPRLHALPQGVSTLVGPCSALTPLGAPEGADGCFKSVTQGGVAMPIKYKYEGYWLSSKASCVDRAGEAVVAQGAARRTLQPNTAPVAWPAPTIVCTPPPAARPTSTHLHPPNPLLWDVQPSASARAACAAAVCCTAPRCLTLMRRASCWARRRARRTSARCLHTRACRSCRAACRRARRPASSCAIPSLKRWGPRVWAWARACAEGLGECGGSACVYVCAAVLRRQADACPPPALSLPSQLPGGQRPGQKVLFRGPRLRHPRRHVHGCSRQRRLL